MRGFAETWSGTVDLLWARLEFFAAKRITGSALPVKPKVLLLAVCILITMPDGSYDSEVREARRRVLRLFRVPSVAIAVWTHVVPELSVGLNAL